MLWRCVLALTGKHRKTFAYLGSLRGQHNCVVACFNAKGIPDPSGPWSKAWVCGRFLAGIAGSNPAEGMDICLLGVLCGESLEVSATGRSFFQRSPTECRVSK